MMTSSFSSFYGFLAVGLLLAALNVATVHSRTEQNEVEVESITLSDSILDYLATAPECDDPELEAAVRHAINMIPSVFMWDQNPFDVIINDEQDAIHHLTCLYSSVQSLQDVAGIAGIMGNHDDLVNNYHIAVHYFNAIGGSAGIKQFLYEAHELITYLQSIDFPNQAVGAVEPIDSWKKFSELQAHKAPLWDMLYEIYQGHPGYGAFLNLMTYTPEKLARILYTNSGSDEMSWELEGIVPEVPFPHFIISEASNFLVAELEVLDILIERGWLTLN